MIPHIVTASCMIWILLLAEAVRQASISFLAASAGVLIANWCICRFSGRIEDINGFGTRLHKVTFHPSNMRTVWLDLAGIPLIPVRSFLLTGEDRIEESGGPIFYYRRVYLDNAVPVPGLGPQLMRNLLNGVLGWLVVFLAVLAIVKSKGL